MLEVKVFSGRKVTKNIFTNKISLASGLIGSKSQENTFTSLSM